MPTSDQERLVQFQHAVHNMTIGDALAQIKNYLPIRAGQAAKGVQQLRIYNIRGSKESDHFLDLQVDIGQSTMSMSTVIRSDVGRVAVEDLLWPGGACHHTRAEVVSVKQQEGSRLPSKSEYISASASGNKFIYWGHGNNACAYDVEQLEKTRAGRALVALASPTKQREVRHSKSMQYLTRQPVSFPDCHYRLAVAELHRYSLTGTWTPTQRSDRPCETSLVLQHQSTMQYVIHLQHKSLTYLQRS